MSTIDEYASDGQFLPLSHWRDKGYSSYIIHNFSRPCDVKEKDDPTNSTGVMLYRVRMNAYRVRKKREDGRAEFKAKMEAERAAFKAKMEDGSLQTLAEGRWKLLRSEDGRVFEATMEDGRLLFVEEFKAEEGRALSNPFEAMCKAKLDAFRRLGRQARDLQQEEEESESESESDRMRDQSHQ